jgi:hypothetical protein
MHESTVNCLYETDICYNIIGPQYHQNLKIQEGFVRIRRDSTKYVNKSQQEIEFIGCYFHSTYIATGVSNRYIKY